MGGVGSALDPEPGGTRVRVDSHGSAAGGFAGDDGAGVPDPEHPCRDDAPAQARRGGADRLRDPVLPGPQQASHRLPQEAAA